MTFATAAVSFIALCGWATRCIRTTRWCHTPGAWPPSFKAWLAQQQAAGKGFTDGQRGRPEKTAEHVASTLGPEAQVFEVPPLPQRGGLGRVHKFFGPALPKVIEELNTALVA